MSHEVSNQDAALQEAIQAIERGETAKAQEILRRLLRAAPNNAVYWVWLSAAVDSVKERRYCLQKAYAADPTYEPARRGLILLGEMPPEGEVAPVRVPHPRAWEAEYRPSVPEPTEKTGTVLPRRVVAGAVALLVLMALSWGAWGAWQRFRPVHLATPQLLIYTTQTATPRPTETPTPIDPLTLGKPTPLALLLPATYTPTPLAVSTPHLVEAYRLGLRAMQEGRWQDALRYFRQTAEAEGEHKADLYFYMGEVYRHQKQWDEAASAYQEALKLQAHFAPAETGLAQVLLAQGKPEEAAKWAAQAVKDDPDYGLAYLVQAEIALRTGQPADALAALQEAESRLPGSPLVPLYRAEADLMLNEPQKAYTEARNAHDLDITLLPAYKVLGQAAFDLGKLDEAVLYFRTYLTYAPGDEAVYRALAEAYLQQGNTEGALAAAKKVVAAAPYNADALRLLAQVYLARNEGEKAVSTLETAVRVHPNDFDLRMALVEAQLAAGHAGEAFHQLQDAQPLLKKQQQWYTFYYWRAKVLGALDVTDAAIEDWKRVLNAPEGMVPEAWQEEARQALDRLLTPSPTPASPATSSPTPTP